MIRVKQSTMIALFLVFLVVGYFLGSVDAAENLIESPASAQTQGPEWRSMRALEGIHEELRQMRRNCD